MKNETILEISGISKRFFGVKTEESFWVLNEIDISIRRGRINALIGANGAGKTTLFNIISGFLNPDEGSITYFDRTGDARQIVHIPAEDTKRATCLSPHKIATLGIGRLFQDVKIYPNLSLIENVMMGSQNRNGEYPLSNFRGKNKEFELQRMHDATSMILKILGDSLSEEMSVSATIGDSSSKPDKWFPKIFANLKHRYVQYGDIFLNPLYRHIQQESLLRNAGEFSFGQQRLIAMAGLIVGDHDLLLLDEPTAGVNPLMIDKILTLIRQYVEKSGKTVIMIEHNMEAVLKVADYCYFMDEGHIKHFGSPADVLGNPKVRREYLGI